MSDHDDLCSASFARLRGRSAGELAPLAGLLGLVIVAFVRPQLIVGHVPHFAATTGAVDNSSGPDE